MASVTTEVLPSGRKSFKAVFPTSRGPGGKRFARKRDAERYAARMELEYERGAQVDPSLGKVTLAEFASDT